MLNRVFCPALRGIEDTWWWISGSAGCLHGKDRIARKNLTLSENDSMRTVECDRAFMDLWNS